MQNITVPLKKISLQLYQHNVNTINQIYIFPKILSYSFIYKELLYYRKSEEELKARLKMLELEREETTLKQLEDTSAIRR